MSTSYTHFTTEEREKLLQFKASGLKQIEMARELGRSRSSVSRELKRNSRADGSYGAFDAEEKYRQRRKHCVRKRRLDNAATKKYVEEKLKEYWSPEQIDGRLKMKHSSIQISYATIYRAVHNGHLDIQKKCLRRGGHRPSPHKDETRGRLHGHKTIHDRPCAANTRSQFGHWEGDTVRGTQGKGAAATFVDRRSGFLVASLMPDRKAKTLTGAVCNAFSAFPKSLLRSFTVDNGNEFFDYSNVEQRLETAVYFADPYCSWQRGLNENTNGLLRQYFPKKCDFLAVSQQDFQAVIHSLNNRPRKRLGFRSPAECFPLSRLLHFT